jgi:PAS domain-containing protein
MSSGSCCLTEQCADPDARQCFRDLEAGPFDGGSSIVITERKRAEEALRQSEQRYRTRSPA